MEDNDKDDNDDKGISALELDKRPGVLRGHQGHWPHDDDNKENDDEMEDNKNNKDDNDDKGISALDFDRNLRVLREYQGH